MVQSAVCERRRHVPGVGERKPTKAEETKMQELFRMDSGDYNPDGPVFCRPSARGIIEKDGKFLLMHSRKFGYYKFPGGGIEAGEDPIQALIREVGEETGCVVIPESV
ncbi:MAG: NUDIX domain-containing protein, partial [Lachnospiraceae bacterium]|nr:NUDIX domain-containing protein [Lachnospiraceae bacterium]